ncbi:MAG TPA: DUF3306 domain-containing protein, partial [Bradyrhizobium sp.]|nr:DUF3306 domain-containing protein [Bradyrhizobium sp.]
MSDEEQSADNKNFLARWSQRKHEAKQPDRDAPTANSDAPSGPVAESEVVQEFDLSSLPKLEDMTATTDITGFLRKGVPEHLRNAALRKSWALDPAIRNYVNPALDYAYDWNTPGGVPGSSEIGSGMDVARLVSQIMGGGSTVEPVVPAVSAGNETAGDPAQCLEHDTIHKSGLELPAQAVRLSKETVSVAQKPANAE